MLQSVNEESLPKSLRGPILIDGIHLPRYWGTIWASYATSGLSKSSTIKKLRYIEALYQFSDDLKGIGSLDDAIAVVDLEALGQILEAYFISIRNQPRVNESSQLKWQTAYQFIRETIARLSKGNIPLDRIKELDTHLHRLDLLYQQLRIGKKRTNNAVRSLPATVIEALYEMLDPVSKNNPFRNETTKWRVFTVFTALLNFGLRRGELLLLESNAVKSRFDAGQGLERYWINIGSKVFDNIDPRYNKPSIKTAYSIRQIPVSELMANILREYVENYRGKPDHPFLLNSQKGKPLSTESITKLFTKIASYLPNSVIRDLKDRTGKSSFSAHDLRHTCAVIRLNQLLKLNDPMDEALQKMRSFFGWSRTSDMPRMYAKAVFEDRLADVWSSAFDDRVSILREFPGGK